MRDSDWNDGNRVFRLGERQIGPDDRYHHPYEVEGQMIGRSATEYRTLPCPQTRKIEIAQSRNLGFHGINPFRRGQPRAWFAQVAEGAAE
jgi:hypothetical protein